MIVTRSFALAAVATIALSAAVPTATAASPAQKLANRYSPVLRLVSYAGSCGAGKPYVPIDVSLLFDEPTVALRGPWGADLVSIAPSARQLARGLFEYHLDFPGTALRPGCSYIDWQRRIAAGRRSVVYAHVAKDAAFPHQLALQYWFFYVFNDWNNLHEGDWEMIQLVFDAATPAAALARRPVEIGYSQHEGAEKAAWDDDKLELVDGTHPVVHPAAGSHANFYGSALHLGATASEGIGCDDTRGPSFDVRPIVHLIPSGPAAARADSPWIAFEGRWGELRPAFFNGPTGPNLKEQWTQPIRWSEDWRSRSLTVPAATALGPGASGFFCGAVASGSTALVQLVHHPLATSLVLIGLLAIVAYTLTRVTWRPSAPFRIASRRTWGQIMAASARMYASRSLLFIGIGLVLVPISLVVSGLQMLLLHATDVVGIQTGGSNKGLPALLVLAASTALTLLGIGIVQAATARALAEIDSGRRVGVVQAYGLARRAAAPLLGALLVTAVVISVLGSSFVGLPIAVLVAGRWALVAPCAEFEKLTSLDVLRRSNALVRGRWLKFTSLIVLGALLVFAAGPAIGVLLILATSAPLWIVNLVAGIVYAIAMPFVAITTSYAYFDARARTQLDVPRPDVLQAEFELTT